MSLDFFFVKRSRESSILFCQYQNENLVKNLFDIYSRICLIYIQEFLFHIYSRICFIYIEESFYIYIFKKKFLNVVSLEFFLK